MRRFLVFLLIASFPAAAVLAADIAVVPDAERQLADATSIGSSLPTVSIGTFPVTARALVTATVKSVDYRWRSLRLGSLREAELRFSLTGVVVDRSRLFSGDVNVDKVEAGSVELGVELSEVSRILGREVRSTAGGLVVTATSSTDFPLSVGASATGFALSAEGSEPVTVELGDVQIFPCAPETSVEGGRLILRCVFRGVPPLFRS